MAVLRANGPHHPDYAFVSCTNLTSVTIPNSVTNIADDAFFSCTGLAGVTNRQWSRQHRGLGVLWLHKPNQR